MNEFGAALYGYGEQRIADRIHTPADTVARFKDGDLFSRVYKAPRCRKAGNTGAYDDYGPHRVLDEGN